IAAGEFDKATQEYIHQYRLDPSAMNSVKLDILNITGPTTRDAIEKVLLEEVQKESKDLGIRTILYEFYVLNEEFFEAFVQVKAIDKVFKENGDRVYKFALTMRSNYNYKLSNKALDYIIEDHQDSPYYFLAYKEKTVNNELQAFATVPLDTVAIREAVASYNELLDKFGRKPSFFDAMYRKAKLTAFYLHDLKGAMDELDQLVKLPIKSSERAEANLLTGDILLMQKEFNKAKLKYSEVADSYKDEQLGAMAKFKEGQMAYYKGDFQYSQERLKSIKDNTSNDISNDAIRLNMLIQDNTGLDSTTVALARFANAQLLIYQREFVPAEVILDSILYNFPNHPLTDEILWEKANMALSRGDLD
ncbi:MAG: hypothetical protein KDD43_16690, partial [Bdellovibrionales bacterium]|nr:hypothetical protein [Bdellovibrionales bacterium]